MISQEVLDFIFEGKDFRLLLVSERYPTPAESLYFPKGDGSDRLVAKCFNELHKIPESAYAYVLIETINANSELDERADLWWNAFHQVTAPESRTELLSYGLGLGVVQVADGAKVEALSTESDQEYGRRVTHLAFGGMWNFVVQQEKQVVAVVDEVLDRDNQFVYRGRDPIQEFAFMLSTSKILDSVPRAVTELVESDMGSISDGRRSRRESRRGGRQRK